VTLDTIDKQHWREVQVFRNIKSESDYDFVVISVDKYNVAYVLNCKNGFNNFIPVDKVKRLYRQGVKVKGVKEDSLGRLRVYPLNKADANKVLASFKNNNSKLSNNMGVNKLKERLYKALPSISYAENKSREWLADTMVNYAVMRNSDNKQIELFRSNGFIGIKWNTDINTNQGTVNVDQLVYVNTEIYCVEAEPKNCELVPKFSIVRTDTNTEIASILLGGQLGREYIIEAINSDMCKLKPGSVRYKKETRFRTKNWFKDYKCQDNINQIVDSIYDAIRFWNRQRTYGFAHYAGMYLAEVIYNYYDRKVIDYSNIRAYNSNLVVGVECPMQFNDGTKVTIAVEKCILDTDGEYFNSVVRYKSGNREVSAFIYALSSLKPMCLNIDTYETAKAARYINDTLLKKLFKNGASAYIMQPTQDDIVLARLRSSVPKGEPVYPGWEYMDYQVLKQLKGSELCGIFPRTTTHKVTDPRTGLEVQVSSRFESSDTEAATALKISYSVARPTIGRTIIHDQIIDFYPSDFKPMSKLHILTPDCLNRVSKELNECFENVVIPKLSEK